MENKSIHTSWAIGIYLIAGLFLFYEMALQVFPGVLANHFFKEVGLSLSVLGWIAGVYFISYTSMQIPAGITLDFISSRRVIVYACGLCCLGTFLFSYESSVIALLLGRFLIGFGSAFAFTAVLVVSNEFFEAKWYPYLVSGAQFLGALGAWGGEAPLAYIVDSYGVLNTEIMMVILGILIIILAWFIIPEKKTTSKGIDMEGFKAGICQISRNPQTYFNALYAFLSWAPVIILGGAWGIPFLEASLQVSTTYAASIIGFIWLSAACCSPLIGIISSYFRSCVYPMCLFSLLGFCASYTFIYYPGTMPILSLIVIGAASAAQLLTFVLVKINSQPASVGTALGLNNMAVVFGGIVFHPLIGYFLDMNQAMAPESAKYELAFLVIPTCFLLSGLIAFLFIDDHDPC